jgi:hypothetical protein
MSKNLTRKGLAFGAFVGLVAAGFTSAPANAAETLSLAPSAGTSYKVLTTTEFELAAGFAGNESDAATKSLKYKITNASGATMSFDVKEAGSVSGTTQDIVYNTASTDAAATAPSVVVSETSGDAVIGTANGLLVSITPEEGVSVSLTVQAFLDTDGGNDIDSNEAVSPARTIEFIDNSKATGKAVIDSAVVGAGKVSAVATLDGLNYDQLDSDDVKVKFYENNVAMNSTADTSAANTGTGYTLYHGTTDASAAESIAGRQNPRAATWSADDAELRATFYPDANTGAANTTYTSTLLLASSVYTAKVYLKPYTGSTYVEVAGSVGAATPSKGEVDSLGAITLVKGSSATGTIVRVGAGTFKVKTLATPNTDKAKAGNIVTFKVAETSANSLAGSVTAGGKTLTNSDITTVQSYTVAVTTDADGYATLEVAYTGLTSGKTFDISATALDTASQVTAQAVTYTAETSDVKVAIDDVYAGKKQTVNGSAFTLTYKIFDQFGQVPVGTYRAVVTEAGTYANYSGTVAFTNGVATFTATENSTTAEAFDITANIEQQNTDLSWDSTPTAAGGALAVTTAVNAYATAPAAVSSIAVSADHDGATTKLALELDDTYTGDKAAQQGSVLFPTLADVSTVTWTVTSATGEALIGQPITVSAAGLQFATDSDNWFGVGSITGTTNGSGQFVVKVYSNLAGSHTLTATVGSVTKTQVLKFAAAAAITGKTLTISGPENVLPGRTLQLVALLVDKYGNAVNTDDAVQDSAVKVTYTGPGLVIGTLPVHTDADGKVTVNALLGAGDTGTVSLKVVYAGADYTFGTDATGVGADDITVVKTVTIGAAAVPAAATKANVVAKTKAFSVSVSGNASAKNVVVKVAGKTVATLKGSASAKTYTVKATKGSKKVTVYVGGKLLLTKTVSVK